MRAEERALLLLRCALGRAVAPLNAEEYRSFACLLGEHFAELATNGMTREALSAHGCGASAAERLARLLECPDTVEHYLAAQGDISVLTCLSDGFPQRLRLLGAHCPPALFCRGDVSLLTRPAVALVGSRRLSAQNRRFAQHIGELAAREGRVLISGGAVGADTAAQEACLDAGGSVVCFVPDALYAHRARPRVLYCSDEGYEAEFTAARALRRNHFIHTAAEMSFVAQCEVGRGGTWAGATDALRRERTPVFVFADGSDGSAALIARGALPVGLEVVSFGDFQPPALSIFD